MWFLYSDWCFLLCERVAGRLLWSWVKLLLFAGGSCGFERRRTQSRAWERAAGLFRNRSLSDAAESSTIYLRMSKNTPHLSVCAFISVVHSRRRRRRSFRKKEEMSPKVRKLLLKLSVTLSADWLFYDFSTIKFLTLARSFMLQGPREKCRFVKIISLKWIRNIYFP